ATDGPTAITATTEQPCHLIVLDLLLPGMGGLEVFRRLRADARTSRVPVIILSAQAAEPERVLGLELGADDYVTKPFSPRELVARVRAVLRRAKSAVTTESMIVLGQLSVDAQRREIRYGGQDVQLTACEFRVLHRLASSPGVVLSREQLGSAIDQTYASLDRTIDAHIKSIRRKLGPGGDEVETVRGFGYRLRAPSAQPMPPANMTLSQPGPAPALAV
ncbi:MAG: response regulator transcription factor, partial [Planctomycetota bacterium]|nr:response regulator transcription factor [Planctomycetota bacterium]